MPTACFNNEVPYDPSVIIEIEILDLADRTVGCADGETFHILHVAQHRKALRFVNECESAVLGVQRTHSRAPTRARLPRRLIWHFVAVSFELFAQWRQRTASFRIGVAGGTGFTSVFSKLCSRGCRLR